MKRFRSILAVLLLTVMMVSMIPVNASAATKLRVTETKFLRLRNGPSMEYSVIGGYKKGSVVTLLKKTNSRWYYVKTADGKKGWMSAGYLKKTNTPVAKAAESASGIAIPTRNVKMRRGPSTNYDVIQVVKTGKVMKIIGKTGSWYKVRYNGKTGFVYKGIVKIKK